MELMSGLAQGFTTLLSPLVLAACVLGLVAGIVAGFLPCLSPSGALALQGSLAGSVAVSFGVRSPAVFVVAFAYGTLYGRALAAINQGAAGLADRPPLASSERPRLFATVLAGVVVSAAAAVFTAGIGRDIVQEFGPFEIVGLMLFLLLGGAAFARGSAAGALAIVVLGLLFGLVGTDIASGTARLTFGIERLEDGFGVVEVALGLFVVANIIDDLIRPRTSAQPATVAAPERPAYGVLPAAIVAALAGFLPTNGSTFATTVGAARSRPASSMLDPARQGSVVDTLRAAMLSDIRLSVSLIAIFLLLLPVDAATPFFYNVVFPQAALMGGKDVMTSVAAVGGLVFATLILAHVVPPIIVSYLAAFRWRPISIDARIVAVVLLAAACLEFWPLNGAGVIAHICIMLAFGAIGYAMLRGGFDRSLMFFSLVIALRLEENIQRSLLVSHGDVAVFLHGRSRRPFCWPASCCLLPFARGATGERSEPAAARRGRKKAAA